ncbi:hypothetical protein [Bradyrhizobium sp. AZCC 2289]|uniref:hypothetical protein n=1 Tax=Bradyrhizobium sp. AZCC 2289 TaxID=3117026 RepID=UPI002FEEFFB7
MTAAAAIGRIAEALEGGQPLDPEDARAVLDGIRAGSVDQALGLSRTRERNEIIRRGIARFLKNESAPADRFEQLLTRYASGAWLRGERELSECPRRNVDKIEECLWRVLKLRDRCLTARQIRRILDI